MPDLKPCPFCGGKAEYKSFVNVEPVIDCKTGAYIGADDYYYEHVRCLTCGAEILMDEDDELKEVIRKWNRRADAEAV